MIHTHVNEPLPIEIDPEYRGSSGDYCLAPARQYLWRLYSL